MASTSISRNVAALLADSFSRGGVVRRQDARELRTEGCAHYKKGAEVRLFASSKRELGELRRALQRAAFAPGSPFEKGRRWCQPLYGRDEVERFLRLVGVRRVRDGSSR